LNDGDYLRGVELDDDPSGANAARRETA